MPVYMPFRRLCHTTLNQLIAAPYIRVVLLASSYLHISSRLSNVNQIEVISSEIDKSLSMCGNIGECLVCVDHCCEIIIPNKMCN